MIPKKAPTAPPTAAETTSAIGAMNSAGTRIPDATCPGRVFEIAGDTTVELSYLNSNDVMKTLEKPFTPGEAWEFPAASVSAVALEIGS